MSFCLCRLFWRIFTMWGNSWYLFWIVNFICFMREFVKFLISKLIQANTEKKESDSSGKSSMKNVKYLCKSKFCNFLLWYNYSKYLNIFSFAFYPQIFRNDTNNKNIFVNFCVPMGSFFSPYFNSTMHLLNIYSDIKVGKGNYTIFKYHDIHFLSYNFSHHT